MSVINSVFAGGVQFPDVASLQASTFVENILPVGNYAEIGVEVMPAINHKMQLGSTTALRNLLAESEGCNPTWTGDLATIADRSIEVEPVGLNYKQCATKFEKTMYAQALQTGVAKFDIRGTALEDVTKMVLTNTIELDARQLFFFGDKSSSIASLKAIDGIFKRLTAELVGSFSGQLLTTPNLATAGNGVAAFDAVYNAQSDPMFALPGQQKRFLCTRTVWNAFLRDVKNASSSDAAHAMLFRDPVTGISEILGIPVIVMPEWDTTIRTLLTVSGVPTNPNRILLTSVNNLIVGTNLEGDMNTLVMDYDPRERENLISAEFSIGAQFRTRTNVVYSR